MFKDVAVPTIGVEFKSYSLQADEQTIKLQIWDTAGQERFRSVSKAYFRNAVGAVLVFDLTQKPSFEQLGLWINDLNTLCAPNAAIILVGNKTDLAEDRAVTESEIQDITKRYELDYLETSAKTGDNISEAFARLGQAVLRRVRSGEVTPVRRPQEVNSDLVAGDRGRERQTAPPGACNC
jgi:small GTP-binding protein